MENAVWILVIIAGIALCLFSTKRDGGSRMLLILALVLIVEGFEGFKESDFKKRASLLKQGFGNPLKTCKHGEYIVIGALDADDKIYSTPKYSGKIHLLLKGKDGNVVYCLGEKTKELKGINTVAGTIVIP